MLYITDIIIRFKLRLRIEIYVSNEIKAIRSSTRLRTKSKISSIRINYSRISVPNLNLNNVVQLDASLLNEVTLIIEIRADLIILALHLVTRYPCDRNINIYAKWKFAGARSVKSISYFSRCMLLLIGNRMLKHFALPLCWNFKRASRRYFDTRLA